MNCERSHLRQGKISISFSGMCHVGIASLVTMRIIPVKNCLQKRAMLCRLSIFRQGRLNKYFMVERFTMHDVCYLYCIDFSVLFCVIMQGL